MSKANEIGKAIEEMIDEAIAGHSFDADDVDGLERFVENVVDEKLRDFEVDAGNVDGLDSAIDDRVGETTMGELADAEEYVDGRIDKRMKECDWVVFLGPALATVVDEALARREASEQNQQTQREWFEMWKAAIDDRVKAMLDGGAFDALAQGVVAEKLDDAGGGLVKEFLENNDRLQGVAMRLLDAKIDSWDEDCQRHMLRLDAVVKEKVDAYFHHVRRIAGVAEDPKGEWAEFVKRQVEERTVKPVGLVELLSSKEAQALVAKEVRNAVTGILASFLSAPLAPPAEKSFLPEGAQAMWYDYDKNSWFDCATGRMCYWDYTHRRFLLK